MKASNWTLLTALGILTSACVLHSTNDGNDSDHRSDKYCDIVLQKTEVTEKECVLNLLAKGYKLYSDMGYYKVYNISSKWGQSWRRCEDDGAHLLIINSEAEANVARKFASNYPSVYAFYIGFHDFFLEGQYVTIHGQSLKAAGYSKWGSGQPDNYRGAENCGAMRRDATLADIHCSSTSWFICERER
uniref:Putative LPSBP4 n=1 Tax=Reticulitermes speratus TaxID=60591 RepID=A0A1V1FT38_9NEOP